MEGYSEPDSSEQEALLLKEEGNALLRAGDARGAVAKYEEALSALGPAQGREQATLLANVSAAQLTLGFADLALEAAKASVVADPSYSKALFREAKALLALRRHSDAVHTARHLLFLAGSSVQRDVERILDGPERRKPRLAVSSDTAPPSSLEATADLLALVARCCEAKELARLGKGNRRFWHQLCKDEELLRLAAALCPQGSSAWLRRDGLSPGWTFAVHQAHARCSVRNMVAVCHHDGLALVPPDGGETVWLPTPAHCLDFTLCWGPHGEYLACRA
ncbi:unnamed protein product [Effrenium voratum]|nr:unnamed protein product [Effrenium voratum]